MNLHDAISMYRLQLEANGRSEHTLAQAERHLKRFREWLGDAPGAERDVETIDATLIARFFVSDAAKLGAGGAPKKATSMNALRSSLRAFFRFLHDAGLVRSDPTRLVKRARCASPPPRAITSTEQAKLLETIAADPTDGARRDRAIVSLMLSTGLRVGSLVGLDIDDLDPQSNEIRIRSMKGGRSDRLPAPSDVMATLVEISADRISGPMFITTRGSRLSRRHIHRRLKEWGHRAELSGSLHPHRLRHTTGQRVFDASGCILTVASVLRHASPVSSARYARVDGSRLRNVIDQTWNHAALIFGTTK